MEKYGLSTKVVDTYLADFHGMAATLQQGEKKRPRASASPRSAPTATACTTSRRPNDPNSAVDVGEPPEDLREVPRGRDRELPEGAGSRTTSRRRRRRRIVWGVQLFYKFMIPFMVGGLVLQIALHLWRVVVNR